MNSIVPDRYLSFWNEFAESASGADESRFYESFYFGDSEEMADELAELVLEGKKRATAASRWSFEDEGKRLPVPGDLSIVTNWAGEPLCIIETTGVEIVPFRDVTEEFAATEGEGDGSLGYWRECHRDYFMRECAKSGREFSEEMLIVCERFRVMRPASAGGSYK